MFSSPRRIEFGCSAETAVFRSGRPSSLNAMEADLAAPRLIVDLGLHSSLEWTPTSGTHRLSAPLHGVERPLHEAAVRRDWDALRDRQGFGISRIREEYSRYLESMAKPAMTIAFVVKSIADSGQYASILIHCDAGKDRTGMVVAMLQSISGVEGERVVLEFARGNTHPSVQVEQVIADAPDDLREVVRRLLEVQPTVLADVLAIR